MRSMAQKLKPIFMYSRFENFSTLIDLYYVLPSISNKLPTWPLKPDHFKIPEIVKGQLADPSYGVSWRDTAITWSRGVLHSL